jgi:hypothetical protein
MGRAKRKKGRYSPFAFHPPAAHESKSFDVATRDREKLEIARSVLDALWRTAHGGMANGE